jgi:Up-regulated During Septation
MISYLRAPRLAQFSSESILRQEEALAELDISIDDWVDKLAQAENRRTRIRQKLLEHIAATLILKPSPKPQGEYTPPRSPQKAESRSSSRGNRRDVESIKIYADSNVYSLLADVEQEIGRMVNFYDDMDEVKC